MAEHEINGKESEDVWLHEVTSRYKYSTWTRKMTKDAFGIVSVYRVPKFLKEQNQAAYLPRVVSLGLFHHKPIYPLPEMDRRKVDAVLRMRQKLPDPNKDALADILKGSVSQIRKCYEDEIEADDETVAWACLLDGCFILEILHVLTLADDEAEDHQLRHRTRPQNVTEEEDSSDPIYNKNRIRSCQFDVLGDFFIMENQIPIFILEKILELQIGNLPDAKKKLYKMLREVSCIIHPFLPKGALEQEDGNLQAGIEEEELKKHRHMLGLFHSFVTAKPSFKKTPNQPATREDGSHICVSIKKFLQKEQPQQQKDKPKQKTMKADYLNKFIKASASELYNSGLKFKPYYGIPSQEELRFDGMKRTIFLPAVFVTDTSEMILRNLMAMEACRPEKHKQLSYYVLLMNTLVEGENDVAVLRRAGVIQSSMGTDDEVMNLLNGLCKGLNLQDDNEDPFVKMKLQLNQWYNQRRMVQLTRFFQQHPRLVKYFSLFWALVLVLAAAVPSFIPIVKSLYNNNS